MPRSSTRPAQRMAGVQRQGFETNDRFVGVKNPCESMGRFVLVSLLPLAFAHAHVAKEEAVVAPAQSVLLALRQLSSI